MMFLKILTIQFLFQNLDCQDIYINVRHVQLITKIFMEAQTLAIALTAM